MYHFIVNPNSRTGKGKLLWITLEAELKLRHINYIAYLTSCSGHATELVKSICATYTGVKNIVTVGGDGTINEVINGIDTYSNVLLGYIPTGSSNDLARGLNLPKNPIKALDRVLSPTRFQYFDHGCLSCNDGNPPRRFSVSSGIGYDADICYEALNSKLKKNLNRIKLGKLVYFLIGLKQVILNRPVEAELTIDGIQKLTIKKLIFVANMIHQCEGGGLPMCPSADPADRKLTSLIVHDMSKIKLLLLMPTIFFAKHINFKGVDIMDCKTIDIKTKTPLITHTDGEYSGTHSHVTLNCNKEQIKMML